MRSAGLLAGRGGLVVAVNRELGTYLAAVVLVSLGMYVHVLLFNLYLADLSLREDLMGRLSGAMTLGTALGTLPAAALARRAGLRATILISLGGLALALALRAVAAGTGLAVASLLTGFFLAGWFVTNAPAIAALSPNTLGPSAEPSDARRSATAFSLNTALAIGIGALGGILAGRLPGWLPGGSPAAAKRSALLAAAVLVALGAVAVLRVRFTPTPQPVPAQSGSAIRNLSRQSRGPQSLLLRRSPARAFLARFLLGVSLWYAFSAGFLPFFNVYLRNRIGASVEAIGGIFAIAQVAQALATLLMAPLIVRLGLVRAVVVSQLLSAAGLLALWPVHTLGVASALYVAYISFQVMSEPGLQNLLMSRIPADEREAASAANLLLMFGIHALVATAAGALIVARGYAALFIALGWTGVAAAALFAALFARAFRSETAPPANGADSFPARRE